MFLCNRSDELSKLEKKNERSFFSIIKMCVETQLLREANIDIRKDFIIYLLYEII